MRHHLTFLDFVRFLKNVPADLHELSCKAVHLQYLHALNLKPACVTHVLLCLCAAAFLQRCDSLRGAESCGRVGGEAVALLQSEPHRLHEPARGQSVAPG